MPVPPLAAAGLSDLAAAGTGVPGQEALGNVDHSAVVVRDDEGKLRIRNQLNLTKPDKNGLPPGYTPGKSNLANNVVELLLDAIDEPEVGMRDKRTSEVGYEIMGKILPNRTANPRAWANVVVFCELPRDGPMCETEELPNGSCNGSDLVCIGDPIAPCTDPAGNGCCPADMCNYFGRCVQLACPEGSGRNYDCECCCTAGQGGDPGSCDDSEVTFNIRDACNAERLCGCSSAPSSEPVTCG